jgi:NAD(P)-dependent dehydrogenase (short-subunit alcohol dehydrogenase family)
MSFSSDLLAGQVGIVTGAGSPLGIGRSLVVALAAAGAKAVYACDLNLANIPSLQEAVKAAGYATHVEGKLLDVADELQTVELLKEITRKHGRFDFFFANAGYAKYRSVLRSLRVT